MRYTTLRIGSKIGSSGALFSGALFYEAQRERLAPELDKRRASLGRKKGNL